MTGRITACFSSRVVFQNVIMYSLTGITFVEFLNVINNKLIVRSIHQIYATRLIKFYNFFFLQIIENLLVSTNIVSLYILLKFIVNFKTEFYICLLCFIRTLQLNINGYSTYYIIHKWRQRLVTKSDFTIFLFYNTKKCT